MVKIKLENSSLEEFSLGITGVEIINKLKIKDGICLYDGQNFIDMQEKLMQPSTLSIVREKDHKALEIIRHDAAHILAQAVKELFPNAQPTIGPVIKDGFYYDFYHDSTFTEEDLVVIEKKMKEISRKKYPTKRSIWTKEEAISHFKNLKEHYKVKVLELIESDIITIYQHGNFMDPCRGPHALDTGYTKYFKLLKVSGAYWRGDSKNEMLQRIYGTAWLTKEDLEDYLFKLEEAKKRDHRKIGKELELFHIQDTAAGMVFWHHKGWTLFKIIENYIRHNLFCEEYIEVNTPNILDRGLWEKSGHWDKFGDDMFILKHENKTSAIKPMNCPCHIEIFKQSVKSYRDLPLRMSEFGKCHRNEPSGALHGLMRVRGFVQDDAHIFCTQEQITSETIKFCNLLMKVYKDFGFKDINVKFSDRPLKRAGSDDVWDKSEDALQKAVKAANLEYTLNPGEGAFYGPKLEFTLIDALDREWQCGTLQVDFILPERLNATYTTNTGDKTHPVMLHRAILGSFERFIGILIENYAGKFPLWLSPIQVVVATITNEVDSYARNVYERLFTSGVRVEIDIGSEKIGYKIRHWTKQKVPIILVLGKEEMLKQKISIRAMDNKKIDANNLEDLIKYIKTCNTKYT